VVCFSVSFDRSEVPAHTQSGRLFLNFCFGPVLKFSIFRVPALHLNLTHKLLFRLIFKEVPEDN
jgi:hypothetical protein